MGASWIIDRLFLYPAMAGSIWSVGGGVARAGEFLKSHYQTSRDSINRDASVLCGIGSWLLSFVAL